MTENWKPVVGYESLYEVSDMGRVRSLTHSVTYEQSKARLAKTALADYQSHAAAPGEGGRGQRGGDDV